MKVVEHVEETVLGTGSGKILDIVYYKDIYPLIEGYEIHNAVAFDGIHVLGLELVAGDVQHHLVREVLLDVYAHRLGNVGFPKPGAAKEEQRVEGSFSGSLGNAFSGAHAHLVAVSFHKVGEAVGGIEAGVDGDALDSGEHKRTGISRGLICGHGHRIVCGHRALFLGKDHAFTVAHGPNKIVELGVCADGAADGKADKVLVCTFYIFAEEIRGDLYGKTGPVQRNRPDGLEPCGHLLRINVVFYDLQTVIPYGDMSFLICHPGCLCQL